MNDASAGRGDDTIGRITVDPQVLGGKPCIAGTRISVELVLEELAAGASADSLQEAYPHLEPADIQAALQYAISAIRHEEIRLLPEGAG
jgi:uncharacterized protein (DUF433 family)